MTYREYYAGQALAGFCKILDSQPPVPEAEVALCVADKMCESLGVNPDADIYDAIAENLRLIVASLPDH